ncbi:MAG: hypothetical protein K8S99_17575 [Planctomycetes bacterium]|nr:hypothetical protein [Planctomycetota bacterium]
MMMRWLFQSRRLLALLALVVLVLALLPNRIVDRITHGPSHAVQMPVGPTSRGIRRVGLWLRPESRENGSAREGDETLKSERDMAVLRYRRLEDELREARERIEQLSQVREQMKNSTVDLLDARVTAWVSEPSAATLRISRGSKAGVGYNMVVASGINLVGRIADDPGAFTANVRLITSANTALAVRIVPAELDAPPREAVATLYAGGNPNELTAVVPATQVVREGDVAYLSDDGWPEEARALVVGRVAGVLPEPTDPLLRRRVVVRPVPTLPALSRVIVIVPHTLEH